MPKALNIRSIVEQEIQSKGYNLSQFSQISGMNRGTLSLILNGNPSKMPSIPQMDKMAEALGYEQGWLYELYLKECFDREVPHWKRLKNFLYRCLQLGKDHMIQQVLDRVLEDSNQTGAIFDAAEEWYEEGYREQLLPLYQCVIIHERYRHAERLAVSHYRIFRLSQSENFENNLRAAIAFEPYRNELPIGFRLDGLLKLANIYFNQHMWEKVEFFADELRELATMAYENRVHMRENRDGERGLQTERHLVVYYGQSFVMKGNSYAKQENYASALIYIKEYEELSWFEGLGDIGMREVLKLSYFSKANFLAINLLMGKIDHLNEYLVFIKSNPNELLPGFMTILDAANKNNFKIENIVDDFLFEVENMKDELLNQDGYYQSASSIERYDELYRKIAVYFFVNQRYNDAINSLLNGLDLSIQIRNPNNVMAYVAMYEGFIVHATDLQKHKFKSIMGEVLKLEEAALSSGIFNGIE